MTVSRPERFAPPGPLGFGGAPLGNMFAAIDDATAAETLLAAWDSGIRHYDTAPHYGAGLSEHRFGQVLRRFDRNEFVLSTKVGRVLTPDPAVKSGPYPFDDGLPFRARYDYSADGTIRSIEDSLQRLGLAQVDIVYVHDIAEDAHGPDWHVAFREAMRGAGRMLTRLREEGVIRAWGLGVNRVAACVAALNQADPDLFLLAGRYTLLDQEALQTLFPACAASGVRVVAGGPFNSGLLAGGDHYNYVSPPAEIMSILACLKRHCCEFGVDIRAAALQFCAAHPVVCTVIPGTKNPERISEFTRLIQQPIPEGFWQVLRRDRLIHEDAPLPS